MVKTAPVSGRQTQEVSMTRLIVTKAHAASIREIAMTRLSEIAEVPHWTKNRNGSQAV
jgi:hypothetical protein